MWFTRLQTTLRPYVPLLLRLGLGFVFLWSGLSKFGVTGANQIGVCTNKGEAVDLVSSLTWLPFDPTVFVNVQSVVEMVIGAMLIIGWQVELATAVVAVLLVMFFAVLNFALVWKNVALLAATVALLGCEPDRFRPFQRRREPALPPPTTV